jgi:lipid A 4'-phosphatase
MALLALMVIDPGIDIAVSSLFYDPAGSFIWREAGIPLFLHEAIQLFARLIGGTLLVGWLFCLFRSWRNSGRNSGRSAKPAAGNSLLGLPRRAWLFLLVSLIAGPGLLANTVFKDQWGRARPAHILEFGGQREHTPPLVLSDQCADNCSFVAGDPALGFWLTAFAFVVPLALSRAVLYGGLAAGALAGLLRIGMGGHFLSDVLYAGVFMILGVGAIHALMFGWRTTAERWRLWLGLPVPAVLRPAVSGARP